MGKHRPRHGPWEERLAVFMSVNALIQFVLDILFEALHMLPTRINHLSLTFLNAFISYKTLSAINKNRFSFMHEDCQILWLMEVCLLFGDIWYAIFDEFSYKFIYIRIFFIGCSLFNFCAVSWIMIKYQLWSMSYKGHGAPAPAQPTFLFRHVQRSFSLTNEVDDGDMRRRSVELPGVPQHIGVGVSEADDDPNDDDEMDETASENDERERRTSTRTTPVAGNTAELPLSVQKKPQPANADEEESETIDARPGVSSLRLLDLQV
jgi:hypothetical protein